MAPGGIHAPCSVRFKDTADLIPHPPKHRELFLIRPNSMGRVIKGPVMAIELTRKDRAYLIRVAANRDHCL